MTNYDEQGATWDDLALTLRANFIDYLDYPTSGSLLVEVKNGEGRVPLPRGKQGIQGPEGKRAAPFSLVKRVTGVDKLPADPDDQDKATAWVIGDPGDLWAWDGEAFVNVGPFQGPKGDLGPVVRIVAGQISATASGADPSHSFEQLGPDLYAYHVALPRGDRGRQGDPGPEGPAASIAKAADVSADFDPQVGDVLRFGPLRTWEASPQWRETGPYAPDASAWSEDNGLVGTTAPQRTVATVNVPGQPFDWRPKVFAGCHVAGPSDGQMALEAKLGSDAGALLARGMAYGGGDQWVSAVPEFGGPAGVNTVVPRGESVTVFLVMRRTQGIFPWKQRKAYGGLQVFCTPVIPEE